MDKILQKYFIKKANEEVQKPSYVGIFLDSGEQAKLFKHATLPDRDPAKCAHHVTIVSPKQINNYKEFIGKLGEQFTLTVNEIIKGKPNEKGEIEAAFVSEIKPENSAAEKTPYYNDNEPHITLSRQTDKVPPHLAGTLRKAPEKEVTPVTLTLKGKLGFFYGVGDAGKVAYSVEECK